jgi:HEAT repeat protein
MKRRAAGLAIAAVAMLGFWMTGCQDPVDKLKSSEPSQVLDGLREVAKRGRPEDVEQIAGVVANQDERVASEAIRTLGEVRGTEAAQVLSQVAQDDGRSAIRASAAMQLGRLEDVASADVLRKLIRADPDPGVREAAIVSLRRLQSLDAVAFLVEAAEAETDVMVQRRAVEAVEGLVGMNFRYNPKASAEERAQAIARMRALAVVAAAALQEKKGDPNWKVNEYAEWQKASLPSSAGQKARK